MKYNKTIFINFQSQITTLKKETNSLQLKKDQQI